MLVIRLVARKEGRGREEEDVKLAAYIGRQHLCPSPLVRFSTVPNPILGLCCLEPPSNACGCDDLHTFASAVLIKKMLNKKYLYTILQVCLSRLLNLHCVFILIAIQSVSSKVASTGHVPPARCKSRGSCNSK